MFHSGHSLCNMHGCSVELITSLFSHVFVYLLLVSNVTKGVLSSIKFIVKTWAFLEMKNSGKRLGTGKWEDGWESRWKRTTWLLQQLVDGKSEICGFLRVFYMSGSDRRIGSYHFNLEEQRSQTKFQGFWFRMTSACASQSGSFIACTLTCLWASLLTFLYSTILSFTFDC